MNFVKQSLFAFLMIALHTTCDVKQEQQRTVIDLNGQWEFKQADESKWMTAEVPGTVHTDLFANQKIEDPFYRKNEFDQQWIGEADWEYKTSFEVDEALLSNDVIDLFFEGLDTYADVYLNGQKVQTADNMFRSWTISSKEHLKLGDNELRVYFHSALKKTIPVYDTMRYQLPTTANDQAEKKVAMLSRKAPYHYGWDWGPRFVTMGIWRPVKLVGWNRSKIDHIYARASSLNDQKATVDLTSEINSLQSGQANLVVSLNNQEIVRESLQVEQGVNTFNTQFEISDPQYWWPNGYGDQYLYDVKVRLVSGSGAILSEKETKLGLRTVEVVQDPDDKGSSFYFKVNGTPMYAKGANYIPQDNFLARVTKERYQHIIRSAAQANMNMIRVWGGGIYEEDLFYQLCDEYGIMVWQDFMFSCSMYPGFPQFLENVKEEAIQNVKRLRNHPSIALWCGNNELEMIWAGRRWKEARESVYSDELMSAYNQVFNDILPSVVAKHHAGIFYWPSSPRSGVAPKQNLTHGDYHYWGVWWGKEPFERYENVVPRFMSEFGFQSFPAFESVKKYTVEEDWDIYSEVMKAHQRSWIGNGTIEEYMKRDYIVPKDFESFLYVGQLLQATGIQYGIEAQRRAKPYCMGSLYWQLNDCWPVASWSGIDYYGKWKALHYAVKDAFEPVLVSTSITNDTLKTWVVSDQMENLQGTLSYKLMDFTGEIIKETQDEIQQTANSSQLQPKIPLKEYLQGVNKSKVLLKVTLAQGEKIVSEKIQYFVKPKDLGLDKPTIKVETQKMQEGVKISLGTDTLAKNVYLKIADETGTFSDNYFDLLPGHTQEVFLKTSSLIAPGDVSIISLADTYEN